MDRIKKWAAKDSTLSALFVIFFVTAVSLRLVVGKTMYTPERLMLMGFQIPEFGLIALGMTFSFLLGGIDLSLVANANLSGIIGAYILTGIWMPGLSPEMSIVCGIVSALAAAVICGSLNGPAGRAS